MNAIQILSDPHGATYLVFKRGRVFAHAVVLNGSVKLTTVRGDELRHFRALKFKGHPYPVARAARRLLEAGRTLGITKGARAMLTAVREQAKETSCTST